MSEKVPGTFWTCLISELSLRSGVKGKLDLETPKDRFWREADLCPVASGGIYRSLTIPSHPERSSGWIDIDTLPWSLHVACWHMAGEGPTRGELKVGFRLRHIPIIRFCMGAHSGPKDIRIAFLGMPSMELGQ
jgi:hypothetical protein